LDESLKVKSVYEADIASCDERSKCSKDCCHKLFRLNQNQRGLLGSEFDQPFLRYSCSDYDAKTHHNMTKKRDEVKKHINKFHNGEVDQFTWLKSLKPRKTASASLEL
jgi:predicted PolB exonuclease-like 3'-5' exonuclease